MTERPAAGCPFCGADDLRPLSIALFVEAGEWQGGHYEVEGTVPGHACTACGGSFADLRELGLTLQ